VYRFDEYDPACRSPLGALPQGTPLSLTLRYQRGYCRVASLIWRRDDEEEHELTLNWQATIGGDDIFSTKLLPDQAGLYWYWFRIETAGGSFIIDRDGPGDISQAPYQFTLYARNLTTPDWIKGGVMYHIFVDRYAKGGARERKMKPGSVLRSDWGGMPHFRPDSEGITHNNDFFGGNLEGIIAKLPLLAEMGITCLYLSPIFEADSSHKYDTGDYLKIDAGFGDEEILRRLCTIAAERGIRVILDGVFSHVGINSVYFNKYDQYPSVGAYQSLNSPYSSWFIFDDWPEKYLCWWDILLLPTIDKHDHSYREFITGPNGVIEHWMDYGIAGWRLDVVDELPDAILNPLCAAARRKKADALVIGEVWEDASNKMAYGVRRHYLLGGQLDSVMNYPLKDGIIAYLREGKVDYLARVLDELTQNYPKAVLDSLMNILGTHDTMRILTVLGGGDFPQTREEMSEYQLSTEQLTRGKALLMIAAALQFTLPGFPCIYYGDEAGMEGGADPFNRYCYPWGKEDSQLLAWYRRLAEIRHALPVFKEGNYRLAAAREGLFAFTRGEGDDAVLIMANIGTEPAVLSSPLFAEFTRERITGTERVKPGVVANGVAIYTKRSNCHERD